jgi:hypothetical protein
MKDLEERGAREKSGNKYYCRLWNEYTYFRIS